MPLKKKTSGRPSSSGSAKTPTAPVSAAKSPRAVQKPLLEGVVAAAKKMLKPRRAAAKVEPVAAPVSAKPEPEEVKTRVSAATLVRRTFTRRKKIEVPPILLGRRPACAAARQRPR